MRYPLGSAATHGCLTARWTSILFLLQWSLVETVDSSFQASTASEIYETSAQASCFSRRPSDVKVDQIDEYRSSGEIRRNTHGGY